MSATATKAKAPKRKRKPRQPWNPRKPPKMSLAGFVRFCSSHITLPSGKPLVIEPFQKVMLRDYFRGVREIVIVIPKKNGKTTLLAALALYHLLHVPDADVAVVANSKDQAMKLFDEARMMVRKSPWLGELLKVNRGYRELRRRDPDDPLNPKEFLGIAKVLAADDDTVDGWGGTLALIDELHRAKDGGLYGVLYDGLGPRDGQLVTISTAGEHEDSPLGKMRNAAYMLPGMVRKGAHRYVTTGTFSLHEWSFDGVKDFDLDDPLAVKPANPASWQDAAELGSRRHSLGMTDHRWARFAAGIWGLGDEPAFDRDQWSECERPGYRIPARAEVTLGFDGARRRDATALIACEIRTGYLEVVGIWEKPESAGDDWEISFDEVDQVVEYAMKRWRVAFFYGDPPYWEEALNTWAGKYGEQKVVAWWTNRLKNVAYAIRGFVEGVASGTLSHEGHPDLTRHVANAVRRETKMRDEDDELLWVIAKASPSSPRKIDAAMASILAWEARGVAIKRGALARKPAGTVTLM